MHVQTIAQLFQSQLLQCTHHFRGGSCVTSIAGPNGMRNYTRDEGGPFGFGNQVLISSHRKLLRTKAVVVSVAGTPGQDSGRHGRERRA